MSLSSYRRSETWIPTPLGAATIASATRELSRSDWWQFAAVCLFALAGLSIVLIAAVAFGPAFDYGGLLAAAG